MRIEIIKQEKITPFYSHLGKIDCKVYYRLVNESKVPVVLYGTTYDGNFRPGGYFLKYDEKTGTFKYPTPDNKPLEWKKRGSLGKETFILCPGASIEFDNLFSSETDSKYQYKITSFISYKINEDPTEIVSPEFRIENAKYPSVWFAPINDPKKPDWEILPQERQTGEVILSKRNELGILSNFAATPFELDGKRYASVEGFWQMMLYPEGPDDERARDKGVIWKFTREQVAQMTAFEAKSAGTLAEENMKTLGIDWCTYQGKRFPYRMATPGEHYRLIVAAMRAKFEQNPEVKRILLATGDLILKPDHHGEENPPPEWKYYEIWMQLRSF